MNIESVLTTLDGVKKAEVGVKAKVVK